MKLSQLIRDLQDLENTMGGSTDVKLRIDEVNTFQPEFTNFWIEQRTNDIVLTFDKAELECEDEL